MIKHAPTVFKPIGAHFTRQGLRLVVVKRPEGLPPVAACRDCFYSNFCSSRLQCSSFEREDGQSVWFVKEDENK